MKLIHSCFFVWYNNSLLFEFLFDYIIYFRCMINRIEIEGYKSIPELIFELKPINILIGSNGVGKSNFISFFKFLNILYQQRLEDYSIRNSADETLHFGRKKTAQISGSVSFNNVNSYSFTLGATNDNRLFVSEELTGFNKEVYGTGGWKISKINENTKEAQIREKKSAISEYVQEYLESFYIYHFHDTSENSPLRNKANVNDNRYLKENGSNLPAYLYYLREKEPISYSRIEKMVQSVAPFIERFNLQPQKLNSQNIEFEWIERGNTEQYFTARHLSDGTIRFIALTTLLLQADLPKTIIIDEPELGLHPVAINKLAGMLQSAASKNCQVIISTQSVGLVNNFRPDDIITVDRNGERTIFQRLEEEKLKEWLENYSVGDLWSKSIINGQP